MVTRRWLRTAEMYRRFGGEHENFDYSDRAAAEMFEYESKGVGNLGGGVFGTPPYNGYAVGKHWLNVQIDMWRQGIAEGILKLEELVSEYPEWLVKQVRRVR